MPILQTEEPHTKVSDTAHGFRGMWLPLQESVRLSITSQLAVGFTSVYNWQYLMEEI